jgi:hypothetical protein
MFQVVKPTDVWAMFPTSRRPLPEQLRRHIPPKISVNVPEIGKAGLIWINMLWIFRSI